MHLPFLKAAMQSLFLGTKLRPQTVADALVQASLNTLHQLVARSISELVWAETEAARARVAIINEAFMMDEQGDGFVSVVGGWILRATMYREKNKDRGVKVYGTYRICLKSLSLVRQLNCLFAHQRFFAHQGFFAHKGFFCPQGILCSPGILCGVLRTRK